MTSREAILEALTKVLFFDKISVKEFQRRWAMTVLEAIDKAGYKIVPKTGVGSENLSHHGVEVDDSRWKV